MSWCINFPVWKTTCNNLLCKQLSQAPFVNNFPGKYTLSALAVNTKKPVRDKTNLNVCYVLPVSARGLWPKCAKTHQWRPGFNFSANRRRAVYPQKRCKSGFGRGPCIVIAGFPTKYKFLSYFLRFVIVLKNVLTKL